jgi:hypothetical protein
MGCSTGGRQGHYQAQNFPQDFDGILAGANAFNWDRFITAELWPEVVMNQEVGGPIAAAKLNAVTAAAVTACDFLDGITDGLIQDPRACTYSATAFVCTANEAHRPIRIVLKTGGSFSGEQDLMGPGTPTNTPGMAWSVVRPLLGLAGTTHSETQMITSNWIHQNAELRLAYGDKPRS